MRILPTTLLSSVASVALAGTVAAHTLTVQLPDGATEQIDYAGDVAPQVTITPRQTTQAQTIDQGQTMDWAFGPPSPFALMQQIAAQMDRDADTMMRQMQDIAAQPVAGPGQPIQIDMGRLPPGTQSYSFVSTLSPSGVCSESTEIIAKGPGQKPQVIRHSSGDCGAPANGAAATNAAAADRAPAAQPAQPPGQSYQARFRQAAPADHPDYRSMFRETSW